MSDTKKPTLMPSLPPRRLYVPIIDMEKPKPMKVAAASMAEIVGKGVSIAAETVDGMPRKRGRPVAPKPWEAEGISRMTYYRRQKKGKKP